MKQLATVISCALLCMYGAYISSGSSPTPTNTVSAAEPLSSLLSPIKIEVHDTISKTIRDTVPQIITKIRYKERKRKPVTMPDTVPVKHLNVRELSHDSIGFRIFKVYELVVKDNTKTDL